MADLDRLGADLLGQAMAAVERAWTDHSAAERSAVADRLNRTATPQAEPGEDAAAGRDPRTRARVRAALSGSVRPIDLVAAGEPAHPGGDGPVGDELREGLAGAVLAQLSGEFDRVVNGGQMRWTMRAAIRATVLRTVVGPSADAGKPGLAAALADVRAVPTDRAGQLLRRIGDRWASGGPGAWTSLQENLFDSALGSGVSSQDLVQALEWASALEGVPETLRLAERAMRVDALLDSYAPLVAGGLVGRDAELARLREVAEAPRSLLVGNGSPDRGIPIVAVTGVGGVGKSTLVGHLVSPYLRAIRGRGPHVATVVVDLDRVAFRPHSETELTYEVAHQLACTWPELADDLERTVTASRREREERHEYYQGGSADVETGGRASRELAYRLGSILRGSNRATQTVLLVLDTFEEWQRERPFPGAPRQSWNDPETQLAEWLTGLQDGAGLQDLRVVVSGRAPVQDWPGFAVLEPVELGDLSPLDAAYLLRWALRTEAVDDLLTDRFVDRLVDIVGCNPLTVRVAARFLAKLGPQERTAFVAEGALVGADELTAEVRRAVLYDRFLGHVRGSDLQQLAHPGLALRRVTPELVQHVLAEPCGLTNITSTRAADLVDRLGDEVWLVTREADGSLKHRPDVRRAMMLLMRDEHRHASPKAARREGPERAERVAQVHAAAAAWFAAPERASLPGAPVEAAYHRLMGASVESDLDDLLQSLASWLPELGEDVEDLHPTVAAQVRLKRGDRLTPTQARHLPERQWRTYVEREGASWLHQDPAAVADLVLLREDLAGELDPSWLAQACWDSGRWGAYWRPTDPNVAMDGTRYGFLNAFVAGTGQALVRWEQAAWRQLAEPTKGEDSDADPAFFLLLTRGPAGALHDERGQRRKPLLPTRRNRDQPTVDQLRSLVARTVWGGRHDEVPRVANTTGLYVPDPVELGWVVESISSAERAAPMVDELREFGARARRAPPERADGLRTYDILNTQAQAFASILDTEVALRRDEATWPGEAASHVLRGDNPEWRAVVRNELVRNAPDDQWLRTLGEIATAMLPVPAVDLRPELQPLLSDKSSRTALITLVEYIDRSRRLGPFLANVSARHSSSAGLRRLSEAFQAWDQAHWDLFAALRELPPR